MLRHPFLMGVEIIRRGKADLLNSCLHILSGQCPPMYIFNDTPRHKFQLHFQDQKIPVYSSQHEQSMNIFGKLNPIQDK